MNNDPKELQPSPDGQQQPPLSQQPATQYGQPQQYSPYDQQQPRWGQRLPLPYGQPFYRQPPYGVSPSPDFGQSPQPKKRSRLWITLAVLGGIVALSCLGITLFVVGSFTRLARPGLTSGVRVLLVPATGTGTPTPAALSATQMLLSERLAAFGLKNASVQELTSGSQPTLQVEVPHFGGDERATLDTLLNTGTLAFWITGPSPIAVGSTFDPTQYTQYNPGGKPQFTGADLDSSQVYVCQDQAGRPEICFEMKGGAISRFGTFTGSDVGQYLTVTLDKTVLESAVIQSPITGPGVITGNFTPQQAAIIASVLKYPSLPVALHIASESSF